MAATPTASATSEETKPPRRSVPENLARRWVRTGLTLARVVRGAPLTLVLVAALWILALATHSLAYGPSDELMSHVGLDTTAISSGRVWTLVTYSFWCQNVWAYLANTALLLLFVVPAERRLGTWRTVALLALCQIGGAALAIGAIEAGSSAGDLWLQSTVGAQYNTAVGASVGVVGLGLALSARMTTLWRRRTRLLLVIGTMLFLFYDGGVIDISRAFAALVGVGVGFALLQPRIRPRRLRLASSHAETRVLVAVFALTSALGPLIAWITNNPYGPMAILVNLFIDEAPTQDDIHDYCTRTSDYYDPVACRASEAEHVLAGTPAILVLFVPVLVLGVIAYGLWRGRRMAWVSALVCEVVLGIVTVRYAQMLVGLTEAQPDEAGVPTAIKIYTGLIMCIPVGVVIVLLLTRRHFALRAPRWTALKLLGTLVAAFLVVGTIYVNWAYRVRGEWSPDATVSALLADYPKRLFSPTWLTLVNENTAAVIPEGGIAKVLYIAVGPVFWSIALGGLLLTFRRTASRGAGEKSQADRLLREYGGSPLSYMTTWPGNDYWISPDGTAAVAYRVIGGIALTTGDPFGKPDARAAAAEGFARYCDSQGWSPCFYSVTGETRSHLVQGLGWSAVQVAEDTVLDLPELKFSGKKWQDVRTALNKAAKEGITAQWFTFPTAPLAVQQHIRELSEEWVADKGLPEMGFTLGGLSELQDPRVRCLVALDEQDRLHGVTSWLPVYQDGETVGWTLDFMRRSSDGFRGVMEFLIASAALGFQEEGARFLSLSGAPLARIDREQPSPAPLQRVLDIVGRTLEPVYGFRSLLAFKAKFQPRYLPLYMCYPDPAALPAIGNAIGRAYLPHTNAAQMVRLSRKLMS
ncbi:rhomboid family intramembrane serine protease [Actinospica sp. MGRD01-02]|uniref:Rhomboid family intramembrane serine protease n=1 Tax=Actinospica acidithermotolerans TaxID=2828514 RepID=A0A941E5U8_9ACTN|nr:rhomboid family intramembrane serine protease [Actinospica acidithermotolerans]MBR7826895.1 rhomboid family intramembrane serine protease [Actinospica acidithermotolerans]